MHQPGGGAGPVETASRGRRGRPRKVAVDEIIDAALRIGLDQVTIGKVADSLGMTAPGIAYHMRTRDDLLALATERAVKTLYPPDQEAAGSFKETIKSFAEGLFAWLRDHPILVMQVAQGRILEENVDRHLERLLGAANPSEIDRDHAIDVISQVTAAVIGAAVVEAAQTSRRSATKQEHKRPRPDHYATVRTVLTALLR
jgi:AcrR family transcriptional regulator